MVRFMHAHTTKHHQTPTQNPTSAERLQLAKKSETIPKRQSTQALRQIAQNCRLHCVGTKLAPGSSQVNAPVELVVVSDAIFTAQTPTQLCESLKNSHIPTQVPRLPLVKIQSPPFIAALH